jgi:hypothetical protein
MGCTISLPLDVDREHYDAICDSLKTGDIVLCSGMGKFSYLVKCFTCSPWSHVGMIVKLDKTRELRERVSKDNNNVYRGPLKVESEDGLYLWHSMNESNNKIVDCITGKPKKGPQLNCLKSVVFRYNGYMYLRMLMRELKSSSITTLENNNNNNDNTLESISLEESVYNTTELINREIRVPDLTAWFNACVKKGYEEDVVELFNSASDCPLIPSSDNFNSYFCSELTAHTYKVLGFIINSSKIGIPSNKYTPDDFYSSDDLPGLKKGLKLTEEIRLTK